MLYRILTNSQYRNDIVGLVSAKFDRFAVLDGAEYRKGVKQYAVVIEIDAPKERQRDVQLVAGAIAALIGGGHRTDAYSLEHTKLESIDPQAEEARVQKEKEEVKTETASIPVAPKTETPKASTKKTLQPKVDGPSQEA